MASTVHGGQTVTKIQSYSHEVKRTVSVDCPHIVKMYNKFMGGIDQMDQHYNAYRIGIRGNKWWWSIFTWGVDVSMQNSWILYCGVTKDISLLDFRRSAV